MGPKVTPPKNKKVLEFGPLFLVGPYFIIFYLFLSYFSYFLPRMGGDTGLRVPPPLCAPLTPSVGMWVSNSRHAGFPNKRGRNSKLIRTKIED